MSQFSGKCDVYDILSDATEEHLRNSDFYIRTSDGREHHLEINNQKDLAKYYPYLTGCMYGSKDRHVVFLSTQSFIDSEEEEFINWAKDDLLKYYRKCKRTKIPYKVKEALEAARFGWNGYADYEIELAKRIEALYKQRCGEFKQQHHLNFGVYYSPKFSWVA